MRRTGTEPPEFTRLACARGLRYTLADWAPGRMAIRSGQPRAGTAAIGPVVAGRWAQPVRLHPLPEAAQHHAQQLAVAPPVALLWPADEPLDHVRRAVWPATQSHRKDGPRFVRSTTRRFDRRPGAWRRRLLSALERSYKSQVAHVASWRQSRNILN